MGAWGHRPRDNDDVMNMLGLVEDNASLMIMAMQRLAEHEDEMWGLLGVVEVLLDAKMTLHKRVVDEAKRECCYLLANGEKFFETFDEPGEARKNCEDMLKRLEGMKTENPLGLVRAINRGEGPKRVKHRRALRGTRRYRTRREKKS